jgi:hypothetical protein
MAMARQQRIIHTIIKPLNITVRVPTIAHITPNYPGFEPQSQNRLESLVP